jgi:hypothetical protein
MKALRIAAPGLLRLMHIEQYQFAALLAPL